MHTVRARHTGAVAFVIAWKLAALALLPAAFCCHAMLEDGRPCCDGGAHGDFCPLDRVPDAQDGPRLQTCDSFDDSLIGLLGLSGFTPESSAPPAPLEAAGRAVPAGHVAVPFPHSPPAPPPRA